MRNSTLSLTILIYILINSTLYLHSNALTYDEYWFFGSSYHKYFTNSLGYGYLYWLFIHLIDSKLILRLLALFSITSVLIVIRKISAKFDFEESRADLVTYVWLTFPAAWWQGKLIGPELYCLALGFWGLYLAIPPEKSNRRKMIGVMLMGIAVGIKITSLIFPIFYYSYTTFTFLEQYKHKNDLSKKIKQYILDEKLGIFFIIGVLIASPDIIFKPMLYWQNLTQFSSTRLSFLFLYYLYIPSIHNFWETIILPSLTWFSLSVPSIICFIVFYKKWSMINKKLAYSFFISFLTSLLLLIKAQVFFSWYFYPIIVLSLIFCLNIRMPKKYFYIIIFVNILSNSPVIFAQITNKVIHIYNEANKQSINAYIESKKSVFSKKYPDFKEYISIRAETGSGIIPLNDHLIHKKPFITPTFFAVSKIMMVAYGNNSTIYHHIAEIFNNNKPKCFQEKVFSLNKGGLKYQINFIGQYKDVYIFTVVPIS